MGYSGLIYAAIVAAWAAFLVPRWIRRNEEVEQAREADTARGVRVLSRRSGRIHALHQAADGSGYTNASVEDHTEHRTRSMRDLDDAFAGAVQRRRRALLILLVSTGVTGVAAKVGSVPGRLPLAVVVLTGLFLVMARRATVSQERRRRRLAAAVAHQRPSVARSMATPAETMQGLGQPPRRLVVPEEPINEAGSDGWQPVPVPQPTYLTKPKASRTARTIDLRQPGSWTSGRLDPTRSIESAQPDSTRSSVPPVHGSSDLEDPPEHRQAVGH
jgi:hypothetical protein